MIFRFSLSWLILLVSFSCTVLAKSNGPRYNAMLRNSRRAARISEFLLPPAPPNNWYRQPAVPVNAPFRHGRTVDTQAPAPTTAEPGYFARFMNWINPFAESSPEPTQPPPSWQQNNQVWTNNQNGELQPPPLIPDANKPPPSYQPPGPPHQQIPPNYPELNSLRFPSPSTNQIRLPPLIGSDCNPCDKEPWIPVFGSADVNSRIATVPEDQQNGAKHISSPSYEIKSPDFNHDIQQTPNNQQPDNRQPTSFPIPYPHLFPGAVPPLFKAVPFDTHQQGSERVIQTTPFDLPSGIPTEKNPDDRSNQLNSEYTHSSPNPFTHVFTTSFSTEIQHTTEEYVDVLPPGAVTESDINNFPPSQPEDYADTRGSGSDNHPISENKQDNSNPKINIVPDDESVFHIEESPVIDISTNDKNANNSSFPTSTPKGATESTVILQNPDGSYGINTTWPTGNSQQVSWPSEEKTSPTERSSVVYTPIYVGEQNLASEIHPNGNNQNADSVVRENAPKNVSSLLIQVFKNELENQKTNIGEKVVTTQAPLYDNEPTISPFAQAVIDSYQNFLKELAAEEKANLEKAAQDNAANETPRARFDPKDIHPGTGFLPSSETSQKNGGQETSQAVNSNPSSQQQGVEKKKRVQIIIPYTHQYTPSPFQRQNGDVNELIGNQARSVSGFSDINLQPQESVRNEQYSSLLGASENLSELQNEARPFFITKTNTSIDPLRLQKNIDNWTILEYSRGTTASTELPSSFQLLQSKKIPADYLTTTEPVSAAATIRDAEKIYGDILSGSSFNDLMQEGSSSSKVVVPHYRVPYFYGEESSESQSTTISNVELSGDEDVSWEEIPVSISTLSNERVYVVTPQSAKAKSLDFNRNIKTIEEMKEDAPKNSSEFESIEKAYQVLPEAVNNLAVASTGPATIPLWGIMEHELYAAPQKNSTASNTPIEYSGHSKVSHMKH